MKNRQRRLFSRAQAIRLLQIGRDAFQKLVDTRQLPELRIGDECRFDSYDIHFLIDSYRAIAQRRYSHEPSQIL